jgi:hypothetical protein
MAPEQAMVPAPEWARAPACHLRLGLPLHHCRRMQTGLRNRQTPPTGTGDYCCS